MLVSFYKPPQGAITLTPYLCTPIPYKRAIGAIHKGIQRANVPQSDSYTP